MQLITTLVTLFSVTMALPTNETHIWYVSDLVIQHQTGLPSKISFDVTDGFKDTAEPVSCEASSDDPTIIDSTALADVSQASCADPAWQFDYTSLEDEDPNESPVGGKLVIRHTLTLLARDDAATAEADESSQEPKVFQGVMNFQADSFKRTVRSKHDSALTRYIGSEDGIVTATLVD